MSDIQNPAAYAAAIERRIKSNAQITRARQLDAALAGDSDEFKAWLLGNLPAGLDALRIKSQADFDAYDEAPASEESYREYQRAVDAWRKRVGYLPDALREAINNFGGLTEKQLAWARSAFQKNIERAAGRDAAENARKASAPAWTAGRQVVEGTIQFARGESYEIGYGRTTFSVKGIVLLDDGRKCWTSIPQGAWPATGEIASALKGQRIKFAATFTPSEDDATMAFGKRPTLK